LPRRTSKGHGLQLSLGHFCLLKLGSRDLSNAARGCAARDP
jgi:hypothetical protein